MYKQTNTICKPKRIRLFAFIINSTILMKTNFRFSRNVFTISDRIWCNKHLRHTTTEKYENNGEGGYFRFDDDNNMSYSYLWKLTNFQIKLHLHLSFLILSLFCLGGVCSNLAVVQSSLYHHYCDGILRTMFAHNHRFQCKNLKTKIKMVNVYVLCHSP